MKKSKIVSAIGGLLIAFGLVGVAWGFQPTSGTETLTVQSGEGYYSYMKISGWLNGHLSGDFTVTAGGTVDFKVLDSAQFEEYSYDLLPSSSLVSRSGGSGEFSVDLPSSGSYYMAFTHGAGSESSEQTVEVSYKITGLDLMFLIGGVVLIVIGAVVSVLGLRMKAKESAAAPPAPAVSDVTVFGSEKKPPT